MKWFDNMSVHITANHGTAVISNKVRPWNGQAKKHVLLDCPDIVKKYSSAMGGVDLADMLISLYQITLQDKEMLSSGCFPFA